MKAIVCGGTLVALEDESKDLAAAAAADGADVASPETFGTSLDEIVRTRAANCLSLLQRPTLDLLRTILMMAQNHPGIEGLDDEELGDEEIDDSSRGINRRR